jgi:hypothetical protein
MEYDVGERLVLRPIEISCRHVVGRNACGCAVWNTVASPFRTILDPVEAIEPRVSLAEECCQMITILIVILVLMLLGAIPAWPHSRSWGVAPSAGLTLVIVILLVLMMTGRL